MKVIRRKERKNPYLALNWAEILNDVQADEIAYVMPESPSRRAYVLLQEAACKFGLTLTTSDGVWASR